MQPETVLQETLKEITRLIEQGGDLDLLRAEKLVRSLIEEDLSKPEPFHLMGAIRAIQQRYELAIEYANTAIQLAPYQPQYRLNKINLLNVVGRAAETLTDAEFLLDLYQNSVEIKTVHRLMAHAHLELFQFQEAIDALSKSDPGYLCDATLFFVFASTGALEKALEELANVATLEHRLPPNTLALLVAKKETLRGGLQPLYDFALNAIQSGHAPELILQVLELPPDDLAPGTREYIGWWRKELAAPDWSNNKERLLELLALSKRLQSDDEAFPAPSIEDLQQSMHWLQDAEAEIEKAQLTWQEPTPALDEGGCVVIEWWGKEARKLTFYLTQRDAEYVRSWGHRIDADMDDGHVKDMDELLALWRWMEGENE